MTASDSTAAFLKEQLAALGTITVRRMFGGAGVFCDGIMFALIADDVVYLKAVDADHAGFEAEGMGPFTYAKSNGATTTMSYWRLPDRLLDDPDDLNVWARRAIAASRAGKSKVAKARERSR